MYSEEYLRDLEMSAHIDRLVREQKKEVMICPVCGRKVDKWVWRTTCCGAELIWTEKKEGGKKMDAIKIEQDIKDIKEAICIIRYYGACDYRADGVVEAGKRLTEITDKWESEVQDEYCD